METVGRLKKILDKFDENEEVITVIQSGILKTPFPVKVTKSKNVTVQVSDRDTTIVARGDEAYVEFTTDASNEMLKKYFAYYSVPFWIVLRRDIE